MSESGTFIASLWRLGQSDLGKVATLRRSLSSDPGEDVRAFPMVERYLPDDRRWNGEWARQMYYLVAGLWATVNTASVIASATEATAAEAEGETPTAAAPPAEPNEIVLGERGRPQRRSFGWTVAQVYRQRGEIESIEQRFIALLDADDAPQLAHHLRQLVQLARAGDGIRIHWVTLLDDLHYWNDDERRVQQRWAREFYRAMSVPNEANDDAAVRPNGEGA